MSKVVLAVLVAVIIALGLKFGIPAPVPKPELQKVPCWAEVKINANPDEIHVFVATCTFIEGRVIAHQS